MTTRALPLLIGIKNIAFEAHNLPKQSWTPSHLQEEGKHLSPPQHLNPSLQVGVVSPQSVSSAPSQ